MHKHPALTLSRIERFLRNDLQPILWARQVPLTTSAYLPAGPWPAPADSLTPAPAPTTQSVEACAFEAVEPGFAWGPVWSDAWFRFEGQIPAEWQGETVIARIDCGAEAIVWDGDEPLQGLDGNHGEFLLAREANGGEPIRLMVRANGMNPHVSCDGKPQDPPAKPFALRHAFLTVFDKELIGLYLDMKVAVGVLREQPETEPRRGQLLYALNQAVNTFDPEDRASIGECRKIVAEVFAKPANASAHHLSAIGHAHIDTAWLWPIERTQQKCLHTFSTATRLMDQYPEYKFVCSQAAQYAWVKELAPKLYERIRDKVKTGQWDIAGAMWVEADCNVSGGESLVRQVLYGKRFWMREFGVESIELWLPDVFGYTAALPQILKKAGVQYFLTQKISWNQINKFPHHTFLWQGIDGTKILTHFPPADTYNGDVSPKELAFNVRNFREHDRATRSLYVFGYGDGGGGPTTEMLENARRLANVEGMPTIEQEKVRDFFAKAEEDARDLPVWVGELYLELHRGTYTTQARNKKNNRYCEFLLRDAEFLACVAPGDLGRYPQAELERAWKLLLINQFHDIIPGSSVNEVYRDSDRDYAEIQRIGEAVVEKALGEIGEAVNTEGTELPVLVVRNYDDWAWNEVVEAPLPDGAEPKSVRFADVDPTPVQIVERDGKRSVLFQEITRAEGHGYTVYDLRSDEADIPNMFEVSDRVLDNGLLRVELDACGNVSRILDRYHEREVMNEGEYANRLLLFEDKPLYWDAWDVDIYYQEKVRALDELDSVEVVEAGPVRGAIRIVRTFGKSRITQTVRLAAGDRRIEFATEVDWHEDRKMLKAAFPVAINTAKAKFEIQYGHVERPTHYNTSWDLARFEVAAQKWVDLAEGGYGVALLNNGRYGHDVQGNTMRLTLLRSPKAPDPEADMGLHSFTYALLPHGGDIWAGQVVEQAYHLNAPPRAKVLPAGQPGSMPNEFVYFDTDREGALIESVKKAEDENAYIVRLYDAYNSRGQVRVRTGLAVRSAYLCDLMERDIEELPFVDGAVSLTLMPFEIVTIKLRV